MSSFLHTKYQVLEAYTPGEQPRDKQYIKLNTNESPYPPSQAVLTALGREDIQDLRLYSDPEGKALKLALARLYGMGADQVFLSNGSDDILNFAFMAFGQDGAVFPDLTYSFYPVFADLHGVPYSTVPLHEDFTVDVPGLSGTGKLTVLANPNAPTGIALPLSEVEKIIASNPDHVVVIDEAYVDFGADSAAALVDRYPNLLVVMTYSKSRSMAGARLGFALGQPELIADLETLKFSTNPYNVNRLTLRAGAAALAEQDYYDANCAAIVDTRADTKRRLEALGFTCTDSRANFLFARHPAADGGDLYRRLKERGVLVRRFDAPRIGDYIRITIGTRAQMDALLERLEGLL